MNHASTTKFTDRQAIVSGVSIARISKLMLGTAIVGVFALPAMAQAAEVKLSDALNRFASEANVEVLFSSEVGETRIAELQSYSGDAEDDLDKLLEDTGLRFEEPRPGVFIVALAETPKVPTARSREIIRTAPEVQKPDVAPILDTREAQAQPTATPAPDVPPIFDLDAPTGVITGQVIDQYSGQPLAGAIVLIEGSGRTTSTDTRGIYRFAVAPVGSYSISVNYLGAEFQSQRVTLASGQRLEANFLLGEELDEVVIYANRSALQQALNQQRAATNSSTVVSADLLGDFPAETIAEALRRVSGVTFSRDATTGEGDRISVRGFNDQAINVQLNGVTLQGTGVDRGVDLSGFLTENIKQVTIQKTLLPSQEATGTGGLVEIETRSGLDYGKKYLNLGIEGQRPFADGFGDEFELSATGAYQLTDDFGLSATVQYRETARTNYDVIYTQSFDTIFPVGFTSIFTIPESFDFPFVPGFDRPFVTGANHTQRERDENNLTVSLNAAYDWGNHTRFRLDLQQIQRDAEFSVSTSTQTILASARNFPIPELGGDVRRRRFYNALRPALASSDNVENLSTRSISFRGETDIDNWEFDYRAGYSKSERERERVSGSFLSNQSRNMTDLISPSTIQTNPDTGGVDRVIDGAVIFAGDQIPLLSLSQLGQGIVNDPGSYYVNFASLSEALDTTETFEVEGDVRRYFANSFLDYIEVGGKYEDRTRNNSDDALSTTSLTAPFIYLRGRDANNRLITTPISDLDSSAFGFLDLSDIGADGVGIPIVTPGGLAGLVDLIDAASVDDPSTPENEALFRLLDRRVSTRDSAAQNNPAKVTENILSAYMETRLELGDFEVIGGARYQREERVGTAISTPAIRRRPENGGFVPREVFFDAGLFQFVDQGGVQETFTPSVIANYRPTDEFVVRGAYFRSTVNPSIAKIVRPSTVVIELRTNLASIPVPTATILEANPDLSPSITDNFDLDFSYYFKDNPGLLRLGFFYKSTQDNFTQTLLNAEQVGSDLEPRILEFLAPLADVDPSLLVLPADTQFFLQRPENGEGGKVYGVEAELIRQIDFLGDSVPNWVENFSVLGNLTYTKSDFESLEPARNDAGDSITLAFQRPAIGQSKWAGNASLRYEDGAFSSSVIYTYQSASAQDYDEFNLNTITPSFDTLDARLSYKIDAKGNRPRMIFYIEGDDLLTGSKEAEIRSATSSQFGDGTADFFFPRNLQFNGGRRVTVGARLTF